MKPKYEVPIMEIIEVETNGFITSSTEHDPTKPPHGNAWGYNNGQHNGHGKGHNPHDNP